MKKGYGCGMLREAEKLAELCSKVSKAIEYPLSVKLRLHKSLEETTRIVRLLKNSGIQAITVHGRYFWQKGEKRGDCDWLAIKKIREELPDIVVIGNGDVKCHDHIQKMIDETGVDCVMMGYYALLNPAIFQSDPVPLSQILKDYLDIARKHQNNFVSVQR